MVKANDRWMEASDVIPMFPTLVWKVQLKAEFHETIDAKILAVLERMRRDGPELALGQGSQSDQTLHERDDGKVQREHNIGEQLIRRGVAHSRCLTSALRGTTRFSAERPLERDGRWAFHTYHSGLLRFSVNAENMMLKLMLTRSFSLLFVSTEWCR